MNIINFVEILLNVSNIDSNLIYEEMIPLSISIKKGNFEVFEFLINNAKVDINKSSSPSTHPLCLAIEKDNKKMIELLLNHPKIDIKSVQNKLFISAAEKGNIEIVKLLLSRQDLDINCNDEGKTAIYFNQGMHKFAFFFNKKFSSNYLISIFFGF